MLHNHLQMTGCMTCTRVIADTRPGAFFEGLGQVILAQEDGSRFAVVCELDCDVSSRDSTTDDFRQERDENNCGAEFQIFEHVDSLTIFQRSAQSRLSPNRYRFSISVSNSGVHRDEHSAAGPMFPDSQQPEGPEFDQRSCFALLRVSSCLRG